MYIPCNYCNYYEHESVNEKTLKKIMSIPENKRKVVRLLIKQYQILRMYQEGIAIDDSYNLQIPPLILKYKNYDSVEVFELFIDVDRNFFE